MSRLDCALAETLIQPRDVAPLLSFFVPTYNRTPEMVETVTRIATQLRDGLETRVEIVISDNASDESGRDAVRELARRFPTVSYYMNARNEGGYRQLFMAPWRVRGDIAGHLARTISCSPAGSPILSASSTPMRQAF